MWFFSTYVDFGTLLNFEAKQKYTVKIRATDPGGYYAEENTEINIGDVNEAPTLPNRTIAVGERSPKGSQVGHPIQGDDVDIGLPGGTDRLFYTLSAGADFNGTVVFVMDRDSGQITVNEDTVSGAQKCTKLINLSRCAKTIILALCRPPRGLPSPLSPIARLGKCTFLCL